MPLLLVVRHERIDLAELGALGHGLFSQMIVLVIDDRPALFLQRNVARPDDGFTGLESERHFLAEEGLLVVL